MKKKIARKPAVKSKTPPAKMPKGTRGPMNPLDRAIMEKRPLPIKGRKKLPPDYDVIMPGMKSSKPKPRRPQGR